MPTFKNTSEKVTYFFSSIVITRFGVPQAIVTDHGKHFHNHMMSELTRKLGFSHESFTPYCPRSNGQVEAINKVIKMMLQRMIGIH